MAQLEFRQSRSHPDCKAINVDCTPYIRALLQDRPGDRFAASDVALDRFVRSSNWLTNFYCNEWLARRQNSR